MCSSDKWAESDLYAYNIITFPRKLHSKKEKNNQKYVY